MTSAARREFRAAIASLEETAAFVEDFANAHGIGPDDTLRLVLVVEELFTNTVTHGHRGDSDATIRIALAADDRAIELHYEDTAPRFDPLSRLELSQSKLAAKMEAQSPGGLGVHLVRHLTEGARYAYEDDRNRLWLTLRRHR